MKNLLPDGFRAGPTNDRMLRWIGTALQASVFALVCAMAYFLWVLAQEAREPVDPILSQRLVGFDPETRYLDRDWAREFTVRRELCSSRDQHVEVVRAWAEHTRGDAVRPVLAFSSQWYDLKRGCHDLYTRQVVPETLPPGRYVYEVSVRVCSSRNACVVHRLDPVPVTITGGMWPDLDFPMPPPAAVPGRSGPDLPGRPSGIGPPAPPVPPVPPVLQPRDADANGAGVGNRELPR